MSNTIEVSILNPIQFYDYNKSQLPQYINQSFTDFQFTRTIRDFENKACYLQKWKTSDSTTLQFRSNFAPLEMDIIGDYGRIFASFTASQKLQDKYEPGMFAYEIQVSFAGYTDGVYYARVKSGATNILISEPMYIAAEQPGTLYHECRNSRYHEDMIFETGIRPAIRVEGSLGRYQPGSKDELFDDQKDNPYVLSSKPSNSQRLSYGGSYGIPDWMVQKLNYIWSCNSVFVDGKSYAKTSETKMSFNEQEDWPMRGMEMIVKFGINRGSLVVNPDVNVNQRLTVIYNIRSKVFGDVSENSSSNIIRILNING